MSALLERLQECAVGERELATRFIDCEMCGGKGTIPDEWPKRANRPGEVQTVKCPTCDGTGEREIQVMTCCRTSDYECRCWEE